MSKHCQQLLELPAQFAGHAGVFVVLTVQCLVEVPRLLTLFEGSSRFCSPASSLVVLVVVSRLLEPKDLVGTDKR